MLRLLLLRHAKAVVSSPGGDFARELAPRGLRDAKHMGRYLVDEGLKPDAILASSAKRTQETAQQVASAFDEAPDAIFTRTLYLADAHAMLNAIRETDPAVSTLLVVGHNPGIAELANLLAARGNPEGREHMSATFPTCALADITFDEEVWQGVGFHGGKLHAFVTPKSLD